MVRQLTDTGWRPSCKPLLIATFPWKDIAVQEPDETWNWDILFTDVSSELMTEWFPETEEEKKNAVKDRPYTAFNRFPV